MSKRPFAWRLKHQAALGLQVTPFGEGYRDYLRDQAVTEFLLRTNAYRVWRGLDPSLVYVSLNPYESGCGNFLSAGNRPPGYLPGEQA